MIYLCAFVTVGVGLVIFALAASLIFMERRVLMRELPLYLVMLGMGSALIATAITSIN